MLSSENVDGGCVSGLVSGDLMLLRVVFLGWLVGVYEWFVVVHLLLLIGWLVSINSHDGLTSGTPILLCFISSFTSSLSHSTHIIPSTLHGNTTTHVACLSFASAFFLSFSLSLSVCFGYHNTAVLHGYTFTSSMNFHMSELFWFLIPYLAGLAFSLR